MTSWEIIYIKKETLNRKKLWKLCEKIYRIPEDVKCLCEKWDITLRVGNRKDMEEGSQEGEPRSCDWDREKLKNPSEILKKTNWHFIFSKGESVL